MAKAFISYKRSALRDARIARYVRDYLRARQHSVFIDDQIQVGQHWPTVISDQLKASDSMIVFLSRYSAKSEMVIEEVTMAHRLRKQRGAPNIMPVRVAYLRPLPYSLNAYLAQTQHVNWARDGDEETISARINAALGGAAPPAAQNGAASLNAQDADDDDGDPRCPAPAFDPSWIDQLDVPGGAVGLQSPFYVERREDTRLAQLIRASGTGSTVRIKGARQMGKTSLLARVAQRARAAGCQVVYLDLQELTDADFQTLDGLLREFANRLAVRLKTATPPDDYWDLDLGPKDRLTGFMASEVLAPATKPVTILMDEVDRVFAFPHYRDDFFSLIRAWHSKRAFDPEWEKLNLVLVYSTEASFFIQDLNQSPFNVGAEVVVRDFDAQQVAILNDRHGAPLSDGEVERMLVECPPTFNRF